jgi:hypothetical protein
MDRTTTHPPSGGGPRDHRDTLVAGLAIGATAVVLAFRKLTDFDLPWHLAFGRLVATTHAIPRYDDFTYSHPLIGYTEWVADIVLYGAMRLTGPFGVQALAALVSGTVVALLYARARGAGAVAGFVTATGALAMTTWLFARPAVTMFLVVGLDLWLVDLHRRTADTHRRRALLAATVPVQLVACNLHQGNAVGAYLLLTYLGYRVMCTLTRGRLGSLLPTADSGELPWTSALVGAAVLATCLNRAGPSYLLRPFHVQSLEGLVTEWDRLSLRFLIDHEPAAGLFLVISAVAILAGRDAETGRWSLSLFDVAVVVLSVAILRYLRMIPATIVLLAPMAARRLGGLLGASRDARATHVISWIALFALAPLVGVRVRDELGVGWDARHMPEGAAHYIETCSPTGRMFNFSPFGGYLEWRLYPSQRVLVDGRLLDFPLNLRAGVADSDPVAFAALASELDLQFAVCRATEWERFCSPIARSRDWAMVYWDDVSAVYARRGGVNDRLVPGGYRVLRHLTAPEVALGQAMHATPGAARDLAHDGDLAMAQAPTSPRAALYGACGAIAMRDRAAFERDVARLSELAPEHPACAVLQAAWREATTPAPGAGP